MSIGVLIVGPVEKRKLLSLRLYAEHHVIPIQEIFRRAVSGETADEFEAPNPCLQIGNYTIAFTVEEQVNKAICRHMSVASVRDGKAPGPDVVQLFMTELGFVNRLNLSQARMDGPITGSAGVPWWTERTPDDRLAINVLEPLDGDLSQLQVREN